MQEEVCLTHFVERALEGFDELGGELADEAHGIGEEEGEVVYDDLAHGRVEGGEELVLGKDLTLSKDIHQCRLPDVRVANEGHTHELPTILALHRHLTVDDLELRLEMGDPILDDPSVGLELRLTRATHPYTPTLTL